MKHCFNCIKTSKSAIKPFTVLHLLLNSHLVYSSESAVPFLVRQLPTAEALHGLRVRRDGLTQLLKGAILITADLYFIQQLGQLPRYCVIYKGKEKEGERANHEFK